MRSSTDVLEAAAERVAARLHEILPQPEAPPQETEAQGQVSPTVETLARLVQALGRVIGGERAEVVRASVAPGPTLEVLLGALSRELIETPTDVETAAAALSALRACMELGDALGAAPSPHDLEDLRRRMGGGDAFELLVEVAHDFRSPLTSILFLAEAMRDGHSGDVSELQRSQLGLMYSAAFGLASVASDVMELARERKGLLDGDEPEPFGLAEVFNNVVRLVSPIVEEKGLELRVTIPDHGRASGYPHALSRVLLNLTTNALKFTDEGHVDLGMRWLPHGRIEYYVQDTGRGIPPERQKDLFHPFKRRLGQDQEGHYFSGSGVGLSIARRMVHAMGSQLEFETSDEGGTRFWFVLPASGRRR